VLTLTLADGQKIIVNSHRAAGQIWMAAFRQAWHFSPREDGGGGCTWHTDSDELRTTLARVLREHLGHPVPLA
jgi:CyaY protein